MPRKLMKRKRMENLEKKNNNIYEKAIKSKQHLFGCPENS